MIILLYASREREIMRKALVFLGGHAPSPGRYEHELADTDLIVAADSGYDTAIAARVRPQVLIGDLDSISQVPGADGPQKVLKYPPDKDETDAELAVQYAVEQAGCDQIIIIGGGGGRFDHLYGVLALFRVKNPPVRWYTAVETIHCVSDQLRISFAHEVKTISVLGIGSEETHIHSEGLHWPLDGFSVSASHNSISNRNVQPDILLEVISGPPVLLLVNDAQS